MKRKQKRRNQPLYYIDQPDINGPEVKMQDNYISRKSDIKKEKRKVEVEEEESSSVELSQDENLEEENKSDNIEEKIKEFLLIPARIAKIRYQVSTKNEVYTGYILELKDRKVTIYYLKGRKKIHIPIEEIVDVRVIGM